MQHKLICYLLKYLISDDIRVRVSGHFIETERDGETYWLIDTLNAKVKKHSKIQVDFEVIANKDISKYLAFQVFILKNTCFTRLLDFVSDTSLLVAINDNWEAVLVPVVPYFEEEISKVIKDHINSIVGKFTRNQLHPDD